MDLINSIGFGKTLKEKTDSNYRILRDNFDNFLSQPLKSEMFVPCDDDGNVLEERLIENYETDFGLLSDYQKYNKQYYKAKEKVLFDGFVFCNSQSEGIGLRLKLFISPYGSSGKIYLTKKKESGYHSWFQLFIIEDLIQCELELTQTAIKNIGL